MTTTNSQGQLNGYGFQIQSEACDTWDAATWDAECESLLLAELQAEWDHELGAQIDEAIIAGMGADGWQAFQNAPCPMETLRAAGRHVGVIRHEAGVAG